MEELGHTTTTMFYLQPMIANYGLNHNIIEESKEPGAYPMANDKAENIIHFLLWSL